MDGTEQIQDTALASVSLASMWAFIPLCQVPNAPVAQSIIYLELQSFMDKQTTHDENWIAEQRKNKGLVINWCTRESTGPKTYATHELVPQNSATTSYQRLSDFPNANLISLPLDHMIFC